MEDIPSQYFFCLGKMPDGISNPQAMFRLFRGV